MANDSLPNIISRAAALAIGKTQYFTGEACKYGHIAERRIANYDCVLCNRERLKPWRQANPDKRAEQSKRYRDKHPETAIKATSKYREVHSEELKVKHREQEKARRASNPERQRAYLDKYKARQKAKQEMIAGRPRAACCDICNSYEVTVFDHCHASMRFRGWLCHRCNRTLGHVKDDPALLRKLIAYLEGDLTVSDRAHAHLIKGPQ